MKRLCVLVGLVLSFVGLGISQTTHTESLITVSDSVETLSDSTKPAIADSTLIAKNDSVVVLNDSIVAMNDSTVVLIDSLRTVIPDSALAAIGMDLRLLPIDSTALIMERVKAVTDMISARSMLDAQLASFSQNIRSSRWGQSVGTL